MNPLGHKVTLPTPNSPSPEGMTNPCTMISGKYKVRILSCLSTNVADSDIESNEGYYGRGSILDNSSCHLAHNLVLKFELISFARQAKVEDPNRANFFGWHHTSRSATGYHPSIIAKESDEKQQSQLKLILSFKQYIVKGELESTLSALAFGLEHDIIDTSFLQFKGKYELVSSSILAATPLAVIHFILGGKNRILMPVQLLSHYLDKFYPSSGFLYIKIPFDVVSYKQIKNYTLNQVLSTVLKPYVRILKSAHIVFLVCGSVVVHKTPYTQLKESSAVSTPGKHKNDSVPIGTAKKPALRLHDVYPSLPKAPDLYN
ncbi:uncharacterized protein EDB93DRAFT_1102831 [Suillus bovinus]|uniref:uncharacterized protein n=1 Tax=Suillus bovinus TaxID=48563 RepID=UPI001B8831E2|nr:uncharacterized protein EDB93DRAFT_1102831 [Suillus bovinus]KAG2153088.1 hypothetical protein EDB93DRAFT_1102831 [Suillus bovinus]